VNSQNNGHEHEFEPEHGLPEPLPAGEKILWQGAPALADMLVRVFHFRKLGVYFALMLLMRAAYLNYTGQSATEVLFAMIWPTALALVALGSVLSLAWLTASTTVYTLTDQRVVMRIGIVLTLTFNLPLRSIETAGLALHANGCGDIPLKLKGNDRIAWLNLWPHARPWRLANPEPMLRCIPNGKSVSALLAQAWSQATGVQAEKPPAVVKASKQAIHWNPSLT
jgi:hypothetical protein